MVSVPFTFMAYDLARSAQWNVEEPITPDAVSSKHIILALCAFFIHSHSLLCSHRLRLPTREKQKTSVYFLFVLHSVRLYQAQRFYLT